MVLESGETKMEPSEQDDGFDNIDDGNNLAGSAEGLVANDDDQQVLGYLEVQPATENATIILESEGIELGQLGQLGQHFLLARGEGELYVVVSAEQDQPLEHSFAQSSVMHPNLIAIEGDSKDQAIVVDGGSQNIEFIETEEIPQGQEEAGHMYIERNGDLTHIRTETTHFSSGSPNDDSTIWAVKDNVVKEDSTEMVFIPTPSVLSSPPLILTTDEPKHRKLMQLAYIAHELQSADQKGNCSTVDTLKTSECSLSIPEGSVIVSQQQIDDSSNTLLLSGSTEVTKEESMEVDENGTQGQITTVLNLDSQNQTAGNVHTFSCYSSTRSIDNTVSVIHPPSSADVCDNSSENGVLKDNHTSEVSVNENSVHQDKNDCNSSQDASVNSNHDGSENDSVSSHNIGSNSNENDCLSLQDISGNGNKSGPENDCISLQDVSRNVNHNGSENDVSLQDVSNTNHDGSAGLEDVLEGIDSRFSDQDNTETNLTNKEFDKTYAADETALSVTENENSNSKEAAVVDDNNTSCHNVQNEFQILDENTNSSVGISSRDSCVVTADDDESKEENEYNSNLSIPMNNREFSSHVEETKEGTNEEKIINSHPDVNACENSTEVFTELSNDVSETESDVNCASRKTEVIQAYSEDNTRCNETSGKQDMRSSVFTYESESSSSMTQAIFSPRRRRKAIPLSSDLDETKDASLSAFPSEIDPSVNKVKEVCQNPTDKCQSMSCEASNNERAETADMDVSSNEETTVIVNKYEASQITFEGALEPNVDNHLEAAEESLKNINENTENSKKSSDLNPPSPIDKKMSFQDENVNRECSKLDTDGFETEKNVNETKIDNNESPLNEDEKYEDLDSAIEETFVKPPKKTYVKKKKTNVIAENKLTNEKDKIELYEEEFSGSLFSGNNEFSEPPVTNTAEVQQPVDHIDDDDMALVSDVKSKVNATYKRKRKSVPPIIREIRTRSLRPRSKRSFESMEDEAEEDSTDDEKTGECLDTGSSESIHWGDYLMGTSFFPSQSTDDASKSSPKKRAPNSSFKRHKSKSSKSEAKKGLEWEKLVKSSPAKLKREESTNKRKVREKVKKQFMSLRNSETFNQQLNNSRNVPRKRGRPKKVKSGVEVKKAGIKIFPTSPAVSPVLDEPFTFRRSSPIPPNRSLEFTCSHCGFASSMVNNLIMHLKYCARKKSAAQMIDYRVDDMDRRQRIRGEDSSDKGKDKAKSSWNFANGSYPDARDISEAECSRRSLLYMDDDDDDDDDDFDEMEASTSCAPRHTFGFAEDDIVWARVNDRFWPALVCHLNKRKASVMLIDSPLPQSA
ncbi:hypothetical protein X975_02338, partial [Stegodyphus mimosarum]